MDAKTPVGLLGVPFDANSSFRPGAARAPAAIRAALGSDAGNAWSEHGVEVWPSARVVDHGNLAVPALAAEAGPIDLITAGVAAALARTPRLAVLGGDHAVTFPVVRAFAAVHGPVDILHFDAHPDLYPDFEGNPWSHASPFARLLEAGCIGRLVQVGLRSYTPAQAEMAARYGVEQYYAHDLARLPATLAFTRPLYVSFDIDGLDPAFAPGVSHPEPGGLSVRHALDIIHSATAPLLCGADVVELNPDCDPTGLTAIVAAKLTRELLGRMISEAGG
jgi:arginase